MTALEELYNAVVEGDAEACRHGVETAIAQGQNPATILNQALIAAMSEVGARFEREEYYVPEMLIAARAMQTALNVLRPLLVESGVKTKGNVAVGTVQGDLHDIGKHLVGMMLEGAGFAVTDLGTDVPPARFVQAARDGAHLIGMSALLTTTMTRMPVVIQSLSQAGLRDKVRVIVGGAPVNQAFADKIGADGYAPDASRAVALTKALLGVD